MLTPLQLAAVHARSHAQRACSACVLLNTVATICCALNNTGSARCALARSRAAAGVERGGLRCPVYCCAPANVVLRAKPNAFRPVSATHAAWRPCGVPARAPRSLAAAAIEHPARAASPGLSLTLLCASARSLRGRRVCAAATQVRNCASAAPSGRRGAGIDAALRAARSAASM